MSETQPEASFTTMPPSRLPTGIKGLDIILQGGLLKGDSYIIMGQPGMGKTILANQMAFNHIASGGRVVFMTVMSETHNRMISHLRSLSFYNIEAVGDTMYYISGYGTLESEGLGGLLTLCRNIIKERKATLLIIDGLATAEDFAPAAINFKSFIKGLDVYSEINGCTLLLLTQRSAGQLLQPEYTMVDGVIELGDDLVDLRYQRKLQVHKFRGSGFLQGRHSFVITSDGIVIYPRIEVQYTNSTIPPQSPEREPFGIERLDEMLGGGLIAGSCTILFGPTGSGKTTLGLQYLANGLAQGEPCMLFGFYEAPSRLLSKASQIGIDLSEYLESGLLQIVWQPPLERDLDELAEKLLTTVRQHNIKRLFIDGLGAFYQVEVYHDRLPRYWAALTNELRALNVTTIFPFELSSVLGGNIELPIQGISVITENIILLRLSEFRSELRYLISVLKERDSDHERQVYELHFTSQGIRVGKVFGNGAPLLNTLTGGQLTSQIITGQDNPANPPGSEVPKD